MQLSFRTVILKDDEQVIYPVAGWKVVPNTVSCAVGWVEHKLIDQITAVAQLGRHGCRLKCVGDVVHVLVLVILRPFHVVAKHQGQKLGFESNGQVWVADGRLLLVNVQIICSRLLA